MWFESAALVTAAATARASASGEARNLRRAGVLEKRSSTSTSVPRGRAATSSVTGPPHSILSRIASGELPSEVVSVSFETEAIEGNASPRNPNVVTFNRSASVEIFDVACRSRLSRASSGDMPDPSSRTRIRSTPPPSTSTSMREAPASRAFSTSSLTADAGRSTTSPAAMRSMTGLSRRWMRGTAGKFIPRPAPSSLATIHK